MHKVSIMTNFVKFKELHNQNSPFILGNVHDAHSALIYEKLGFNAIGTSSAAIATSLGLEDGERMSFSELTSVVEQITSKTNLPLTVDIEGGYSSDVDDICNNIRTLAMFGVVGINLEDSVVSEERKIENKNDFANKIEQLKSFITRKNIQIFVNIRTDFYIMGLADPFKNTLERIKLYENAGADGIFVPCLTDKTEIKKIVNTIKLPLNVMTMPGFPDYQSLTEIGVKRISMGPFAYNKMMSIFEKNAQKIITSNDFDSLF